MFVNADPKVAVVCGGGGTFGAAQVGMISSLTGRGVTPDLVVGCSIGALNGAALASDPTSAGAARLEGLWRNLRNRDFFGGHSLAGGMVAFLRRGPSVHSNDGLRAIIEHWLPATRFEQLPTSLHVAATQLDTGLQKWFDHGDLVRPLLASAAYPGLFPAVAIEGRNYIDGGVVDNTPLGHAIQLGATEIYVLPCADTSMGSVEVRRPVDLLKAAWRIGRRAQLNDALDRYRDSVRIHVVPAVDVTGMRPNDLRHSSELIDRGFEAAESLFETAAVSA